MPIEKSEKEYIVDKVVEILKSPDKKTLIEELKDKVFKQVTDHDEESTDEVIYAVIQAIDEIYG